MFEFLSEMSNPPRTIFFHWNILKLLLCFRDTSVYQNMFVLEESACVSVFRLLPLCLAYEVLILERHFLMVGEMSGSSQVTGNFPRFKGVNSGELQLDYQAATNLCMLRIWECWTTI